MPVLTLSLEGHRFLNVCYNVTLISTCKRPKIVNSLYEEEKEVESTAHALCHCPDIGNLIGRIFGNIEVSKGDTMESTLS